MDLNWNEIKSRELLFCKAKPFWIAFFEIFGITDKRVATFELNVKKLGGSQDFVDLFCLGVLLVEHKSRGKNLDDAVDQAVGYLHNLPEFALNPRLQLVSSNALTRMMATKSSRYVARTTICTTPDEYSKPRQGVVLNGN